MELLHIDHPIHQSNMDNYYPYEIFPAEYGWRRMNSSIADFSKSYFYILLPIKNKNKVPSFKSDIEKFLHQKNKFLFDNGWCFERGQEEDLPSYSSFLRSINASYLEDDRKYNNRQYFYHYIRRAWRIDGMDGYTEYREDDSPHSLIPEQEPQFFDLDVILLNYWKDISFLEYKLWFSPKGIILQHDQIKADYFGNYETTRYETVRLIDLYELLMRKIYDPR